MVFRAGSIYRRGSGGLTNKGFDLHILTYALGIMCRISTKFVLTVFDKTYSKDVFLHFCLFDVINYLFTK